MGSRGRFAEKRDRVDIRIRLDKDISNDLEEVKNIILNGDENFEVTKTELVNALLRVALDVFFIAEQVRVRKCHTKLD